MDVKFYMCCVDPQGRYTFEGAMELAEELAKKNGNKKVYVLEAIKYCEVKEPPSWWTNL